MEGIEVSPRNYHEKSAGILSETSSWTRDLSDMPSMLTLEEMRWKRWLVEV